MADTSIARGRNDRRKTAAAAIAVGELHQLADGLPAFKDGLSAAVNGDTNVRFVPTGQATCPKLASVVCLDGGRAYWDHANNWVTPLKPTSGRGFLLGSFVGDAASADSTCVVNIDVPPRYEIELREGYWTTEAALGLGVTLLPGGSVQLAFDAVAEVAQAAIYSERTVPIASNPIFECRLAIFDVGDNAALDIDVGLASSSHASNFETITDFVSFHWDGADLSIWAQSDDGTTDVAPVDTTLNAVDDTFLELWIDGRDPTSLKLYVNGVRVLSGTTFSWAAATGPVKAICLIEKTSDDTLADVRIEDMRVRIAEQ